MVRNVVPERARRRIGLLTVVVVLALPACGAASAGTRPDGSDTPTKSSFGHAGTTGCFDAAGSLRRAATAPGGGKPIASLPGSGQALRKVAAPVEASAVATVPVSGPGELVAVRGAAKTAFGGMHAAGAASPGSASPCG